MSTAHIHVAHAVSRRGGTTYRALAVVRNDGCKGFHTERLCMDDTREAATDGAIQYIRDAYTRDGLAKPVSVVDHGRVRADELESRLFVKRLDF